MKKLPSHLLPGAKIAIVGEAPTQKDMDKGKPFSSSGGYDLRQMLAASGVSLDECSLLNVFRQPAPGGDVLEWCGPKGEVQAEWESLQGWVAPVKKQKLPKKKVKPICPSMDVTIESLFGDLAAPSIKEILNHEDAPSTEGPRPLYPYPVFKAPGKYFRPSICQPALAELKAELESLQPNIIISLGNAALWALCGTSGIASLRGTTCECTLVPGLKVLPTYHPIAASRDYSLRPILQVDLEKAIRESAFPEIRPPKREIWINPSLTDLWEFYNRYLAVGTTPIAVDIETEARQVTCIGFAPNKRIALVVPIWDKRKPDNSYWRSQREELCAWAFIRHVLNSPRPQLYHNGMYDLTFNLRAYGITAKHPLEDSMLLSHSLQPEMLKGLGFLGSVHCDEPAWKFMRKVKAKDAALGKSDDE